jgi:hypothetical protein
MQIVADLVLEFLIAIALSPESGKKMRRIAGELVFCSDNFLQILFREGVLSTPSLKSRVFLFKPLSVGSEVGKYIQIYGKVYINL